MTEDKTHVQNLDSLEAIEKMQELVKHSSMCFFTTKLDALPLQTRPMNVLQVDDAGNFWFLSAVDSAKNKEIQNDPRVQLFLSNTSDSEYLSVYGKATITKDKSKIEELWMPLVKAWFTEGKDDPRITAIKIAPEKGFYWDTKNGKVISLIKILAATVTGKSMDGSIEGELEVNQNSAKH